MLVVDATPSQERLKNINQNHATAAANGRLEDGHQKPGSRHSPVISTVDATRTGGGGCNNASYSPWRQRGRGRLGTGGDAEDGWRARARAVGGMEGRGSLSSVLEGDSPDATSPEQQSRTGNPSGDMSGGRGGADSPGAENGDPMGTGGLFISPNEASEGHDGRTLLREITPVSPAEDGRGLSPWHSAEGGDILTTMTETTTRDGVVGGDNCRSQKQHQYQQQEANKQERWWLKKEGLFGQGTGGDDGDDVGRGNSTGEESGTKNGDISYTSPGFRGNSSRDTADASTTRVPQESIGPFGRVEYCNDGSRESGIQLGSDVQSMPPGKAAIATTTHASATQTPLTSSSILKATQDKPASPPGRKGDRKEVAEQGMEGKSGKGTESRETLRAIEDGTRMSDKQERVLSAFLQGVRHPGFVA